MHILIIHIDCRYRLAPDNKFPVPMEDCTDATIHFIQNAQQFDVDPNRIAVMGKNKFFIRLNTLNK